MPKTRRQAYDAAYKLAAIDLAVEKGNRAAAQQIGVNESMIRRWRKQRGELVKCKKSTKAFRGCKARWPQLENEMEDWVNTQRADGRGVSTVQLRLKARTIATRLKIDDFKGGQSWCCRFLRRKGLSLRARTTLCQQLPPDFQEKMMSFRNYAQEQVAENLIGPQNIINMDEVPLTFDLPLTRTVNKKGESSVALKTTGHEKTHFTCVLSCTASGEKLPPMVIFKRITMPKEKFPKGIVVQVNKKGWMDEKMMDTWLTECYGKRPGGFFRRTKALLVMDSMRAHITEKVKKSITATNSIIAIIPGGTTKYLQPLDISVNRPFKVVMRDEWERWMVDGEKSFTKTGRMRRATFADVCQWVLKAWDAVKKSTIINGFRKAEIITGADDATDNTTATDSGAESDTSGDSVPEAILNLFISDTEESDFSGFSASDVE
ncbi:hypothetical protein V1264_016230 [Littorina saxatilis]|uniref:HTH CENPB-type domain-containing protein n=1 Tax=Littorina saxatilis TaxID=31220 RepID=A0AAN9G7A9_9CAEN